MILSTPNATLRPFLLSDAPSLAKYANNARIAACVRDGFPHPYTEENAVEFIEMTREAMPCRVFAIEVAGEVVGGIGLHPQEDIHRKTMELGYWLGEPFWGKGIVTDAVKAIIAYGFQQFDITRIFAYTMSNNVASSRVLEKAGFLYEGTQRKAIFKNGQVLDSLMFGFVNG